MTKEELQQHKLQFEKSMHFMIIASRERDFVKDDFVTLNWIARNLDRLRNYRPDELSWDESAKEVIIIK